MTTLPQMSSMRLPRAGGGPGSIAMTPHMAMGGAIAAPQPPRMTGGDVWRVIRGHLWLIITLVVAMGGLGYVANNYLASHYPRYTAVGWLQVQPYVVFDPLHATVPVMDPSSTALEQRTQAQLLKSESLFSAVLGKTDGKIRELGWFKEMAGADGKDIEAAKKDLRDNLAVVWVPDTKLIQVMMTYRDPKDARTIVDEIVNEHLNEQRKTNQDRQLQRSQTLNLMRETISARLKDIESELRNTSIALNINGVGVPGRMNAKELELSELLRRQLELQALASTAQAQQKAQADLIQQGLSSPKVEEYINRDTAIQNYRQMLDQYDMQIAMAGGENQRTANMKRMREMIVKKLDDKESEMRNQAQQMLLQDLTQSAKQAQDALDSVTKRIDAIKEDLGAYATQMNTYSARKDEEKALQTQMNQVDAQLDQILQTNNQQDGMATVQWMSRPDIPGTMSFPKLAYTMSAAIFLGLALSLGIAFLREALDTSVRSPRDVARVGQLNLLGMVPDEQDDPQAAGSRLPLVIFDAPNSATAEQFRQVRTRLQQAASLDTTRSLMITSPSPGDGKSTVAVNLAAGLALNGRKILLVDANFRRPDLHKIFGIDNNVGFSDVLASADRFNEAARETPIPNLSVMGTGPKPANPTELLESQLLTDFIEVALREYDHVIFDSGPLLFVSDSVALAPRVDGVVTVVRARTNSRGLLQRMRDTLRQIKAEHLGVVLNAVRAQGGGYYGRNIKTYYAYQNGNAA